MNRDAAEIVKILAQALLVCVIAGINLFYLAVPPTQITLANGTTGWYQPNKIDALWFTIQTITTTGYGSFPSEVWNPNLKLVSIVLMASATVIWTFLLGLLVNMAWHRIK